MTRKGKRLALIGGALAVLALAVGLVLFALRDNIVFFYTPAELAQKQSGAGHAAAHRRAGERGLGRRAARIATSPSPSPTGPATLSVTYTGLLPDLFREGQGVVVDGDARRRTACFRADSVLAKHDERYMPREVADALKKQGVLARATASERPKK